MSAPGTIQYNADFKANTSPATQSLKDYEAQIKAVRKEIAQSTREARDNYQQQMLSARAAGASTEQLAKIQQKWAQDQLAIKNTQKELTDSILKGNYSALESEDALQRVRQEAISTLKQQTVAVEQLAAAQKAQHGAEVTGSIAGGAAIRTVDGGQNIRAVENFLAKTLGLGGVFQAIFPVVGAVALLQILGEMGERLYEIRHKALEAGSAIKEAMEESHAKALVAIDDLNIQADKLQMNIDKLQGRPNNGLALALDEARKMADQLQASLAADRKELSALLKEHSVGTFGSLLSGVAATGKQEKQMNADHKELEDRVAGINRQFQIDASNAKTLDDVKLAGQKRDEAIRQAVQATIETYKREVSRLRTEEAASEAEAARANAYAAKQGHGPSVSPIDNSAKIANVDAVISRYSDLLATQKAQQKVAKLTERDNALKGAKESSSLAIEAARRAAEAQRKQWELNFAIFNESGNRTLDEQTRFWSDVRSTAQTGSENYLEASRKVAELIRRSNEERHKQFAEGLKWNQQYGNADTKAIASILQPGLNADAKGMVENQNALHELSKAQREVAFNLAESQVQYDLSTGKVNKHDAAIRLQTLHMQEYAAQLSDLNDQLNAITDNDPHSQAQRNRIRQQIVDVTGHRDMTSMQDASAVNTSSLTVAVRSAIQSAFNPQVIAAIFGEGTHWGQAFTGLGKQVAGAGLNKVEGGILDALGLGKADGSTQDKALWVRMASSASSSVTGVLSKIPVLGSLFGGRAVGGGVEAGQTVWVGENGPELATFGSSAFVTPNSRVAATLGSGLGDTHNWNIDARGSNDPAAVRAQVIQGIKEATPHIIKASQKTMVDSRFRRPMSAGGR